MRLSRTLALAASLMASASIAKAADGNEVVETVTTPETTPAPDATPSLPWLGLMADAGIPDGMQGSIVLRPWRWLRTSVGGGYNMISKGVRGGLSILPFGRGPSATIEAGRFFDGDANQTARKYFAGYNDNNPFAPALERVGYDYANLHLGLDFGYKRVTFYIHGGMSYVRGQIHNVNQVANSNPSINGVDMNGLEVKFVGDPTYKVIGPSAKLGLIVYLW
ncbi:MAG TPA: hypothetical protein VHJ20_12640 [Polyangia bacterium]|nr:hypothetical protein [Polyangia bacterium]